MGKYAHFVWYRQVSGTLRSCRNSWLVQFCKSAQILSFLPTPFFWHGTVAVLLSLSVLVLGWIVHQFLGCICVSAISFIDCWACVQAVQCPPSIKRIYWHWCLDFMHSYHILFCSNSMHSYHRCYGLRVHNGSPKYTYHYAFLQAPSLFWPPKNGRRSFHLGVNKKEIHLIVCTELTSYILYSKTADAILWILYMYW